jgi:hypothetical protein
MNILELQNEVKTKYDKCDPKELDVKICQRGINHIDDTLLADCVQKVPEKLTKIQERLDDLAVRNPSAEQVLKITDSLVKLNTQRIQAKEALRAARVAKTDTDTLQILANAVANIDGKMSPLYELLGIDSQIKSLERKITSIKDKFALAIEEQKLRSSKSVTREYIHSTYYMDFEPATHSHLSGTITFTNASATVSGSGSNFDPEVTVGDYIRQSDGTEWYKVTARAAGADTSLTISPAFQQSTHTDDAGASFICVSATNDGSTTSLAFPHLNRYTTDTVRTAGDILKVRANQTHVLTGLTIDFDEDGTPSQYLEVRGCSVADDPFSDSSNVKPIFSYGGSTANYLFLSGDDYWRLFNISVINNAASAFGLISVYLSIGYIIDTCTIYGNANSAGVGIFADTSRGTITGCTIYGNKSKNIALGTNGYHYITDCVLNGGVATTDYGIWNLQNIVDISNTTFAVTTAHDVVSIRTDRTPIICRNCNLNDTVKVVWAANLIGQVTSEDDAQTIGNQTSWQPNGTITKSAIVRTGGASSSAKMMPAATYCTTEYPLTMAASKLVPDFAVWCPASATTVTIYLRSVGIWATYPTAAQLFIQADYWAGAGAIRSKSTASTQLLTDGMEPAVGGHYHMDAGSGTTTIVDSELASRVNDFYKGWYVYNTTRSAGAEITAYNGATKTITCGTIAGQADTDAYYLINWVGFTTTFTPGTAGWVYLKVNLGLYESTRGIYVDVKPVIS